MNGSKGGRPSVLTPETQEKILAALRCGVSRAAAATRAGVGPRTLREWMAREDDVEPYASFRVAVEEAESACEARLVAVVFKAALEDPNQARWLLERRFRASWGRTVPEDQQGPAPQVPSTSPWWEAGNQPGQPQARQPGEGLPPRPWGRLRRREPRNDGCPPPMGYPAPDTHARPRPPTKPVGLRTARACGALGGTLSPARASSAPRARAGAPPSWLPLNKPGQGRGKLGEGRDKPGQGWTNVGRT